MVCYALLENGLNLPTKELVKESHNLKKIIAWNPTVDRGVWCGGNRRVLRWWHFHPVQHKCFGCLPFVMISDHHKAEAHAGITIILFSIPWSVCFDTLDMRWGREKPNIFSCPATFDGIHTMSEQGLRQGMQKQETCRVQNVENWVKHVAFPIRLPGESICFHSGLKWILYCLQSV